MQIVTTLSRTAPRGSQPLRGRTVVITGASAGVGRATALRFARAGADLALIAREASALKEVQREAECLGGTATVFPADVADADAVLRAAEAVAATHGAIDVWINNAMVTVFSPVWRMTPQEFRRVTEVTYLGVVQGTMAALRHMRPQNRGTIVNVGSALAYRAIPLQSAYCGAKYAIRGFTDALRSELIHTRSGIAVTMIDLPAVNTPQFDWARSHMDKNPRPVPPVFQPEVIADVILRAALHPRREYWIGVSTIKAILANMMVPAYLDRYLARNVFDQQETNVPLSATRKDNLMEPVSGLHRTHGRFDKEAADSALTVPGSAARLGPIFAAGLGGIAACWLVHLMSGRRARPRRSNLFW